MKASYTSYLKKEGQRSRWDLAVFVVALAATLTIGIMVVMWRAEVIKFAEYGYVGDLIVSFLAAVISFIPVPAVFIVFTLGAALNPIVVGLIAGAGETLGSMVVYMTSLSGAKAFHALDHQVMERLGAWIRDRGTLSVFGMSSILNPFFYPFTVMAGVMHFGWWRFMIPCLLGKSLKNILVAGAGFYGMQALLNLVGGTIPL